MPAIPSAALTAPSCIAPPRESVGSSSCSASTPPHRRWYCSALRSMPALATGLPSSVKPSAPCSLSSAISVSCSPPRPARDRGEEPDRDAGLAARGLAQRAEQRRRVEHRIGVGHRDHAGVAARRRGARAGLEILLVLLAGGPQVDVGVEEGRHRDQPPVALDRLLRVEAGSSAPGLAQLGDAPLAHADVAARVEALARVERADVAQQDVRGVPGPRRRAARGGSRLPALTRCEELAGASTACSGARALGEALSASRVPAEPASSS